MKKLYFFLLLITQSLTPSYHKYDTSTKTNSTELVPIYYKTIPTQPLLLHTLNQTPNQNLMQQLYSNAKRLVEDRTLTLSKLEYLSQLITEIKKHTIHTDILAQFAYTKQSTNNFADRKTTLLFGCLKHYYLTIKNTNEQLPFNVYTKKEHNIISQNRLKQAFDIQNADQQKSIKPSYVNLAKYPAFLALIDFYDKAHSSPYDLLRDLTSCLHSNEPTIFPPYPSSAFNLDQFYNTTYNLLFSNENSIKTDTLCTLIHMIETAKTTPSIKNNLDFGYTLLKFTPTRYILDFGINCCSLNYCYDTTKNRISLFYLLIEKYNSRRHYKKTPYGRQYDYYKFIKEINLALPDNFSTNLFNLDTYAFEELSELIKDIKALNEVNDNYIEECVKSYYPKKTNPHK